MELQIKFKMERITQNFLQCFEDLKQLEEMKGRLIKAE